MPTGFTYDSYQSAVVTQIPSLPSDPNFQTMLPAAIDYAELSICRDLDFLAMHGQMALGNTTIGTAAVALPTSLVVLESLFYGPTTIPVPPASQDYILLAYAGAANGPPERFAVAGAASGAGWTPGTQIVLGPAPDAVYALTGYGTQRQATLSASTPATFISQNLPDLFWAASMIFWAGYNRNFGAQSDDPRQAVSWSAEYQRLLHGADVEEARKKFRYQGWQSQFPVPPAVPPVAAPR
jgi:hypothetical protein